MASIVISYETGTNSDSPIGKLGGDQYNLAMSFTTVDAISVPYIDLYLKKVNTITDTITFRLETDAAGPKASGTLVNANATITVTPTSTTYDWIRFTFPANIPLAAATKYWSVCTVPDGQAVNNRYDWARTTPSGGYTGGGQSVQVNLGAWSNEQTGDDCYFRVYKQDPGGGFFLLL